MGGRAEEIVQRSKKPLEKSSAIARPEVNDLLQLYNYASRKTVEAALVLEKNKVQQPVYFVSHVLISVEKIYLLIEKMAFAITIATRKLKPYAHKSAGTD